MNSPSDTYLFPFRPSPSKWIACGIVAFLSASLVVLPSTSFVLQSSHARTEARSRLRMSSNEGQFSIPDQPARFARAKEENNRRYLDICSVYDPSYLKGKRVAVTGANRGIGYALANELKHQGAIVIGICRSSSPEMERLELEEVVLDIDVTDDDLGPKLLSKIKGGPIDIVCVMCRISHRSYPSIPLCIHR